MKLSTLARIPLVALLASACSVTPGVQPTSSRVPPASPGPTAAATPGPTATAPPVATPTAPDTHPPRPTESVPPGGFLGGGETDPVEGWRGSYCWHGTCADAAAIPAIDDLPSVHISDSEMEFSLSHRATFVKWRATYTSDEADEPVTLGQGGEGFDPDAVRSPGAESLATVRFAAPPAGDSVVFVQVFFDGGDLSYAWHVSVR